MPDPDRVGGLADLTDLLGALRARAGRPSYRVLARRVGPLMEPPQTVSASTVVDVFRTGRRRLGMDLVLAIVRALGVTGDADLARWREAYVRAHVTAESAGPTPRIRWREPADSPTRSCM